MIWTEEKGRQALRERTEGRCEVHATHLGTDWSHRRSRAHLGTWEPSNGLWICRSAHEAFERRPDVATAGGWRLVRDDRDPETVPVWLAWPFPGWWRLTFDTEEGIDIKRHIIAWVDDPAAYDLPEQPHVLPPQRRAA